MQQRTAAGALRRDPAACSHASLGFEISLSKRVHGLSSSAPLLARFGVSLQPARTRVQGSGSAGQAACSRAPLLARVVVVLLLRRQLLPELSLYGLQIRPEGVGTLRLLGLLGLRMLRFESALTLQH